MTAARLNGDGIAAVSQVSCLVVDDEPRLRQVLLHLMRGDGFTCYEAGNGAEALDVLDRHRVPLVMSDMRMPRMDGIELLREVRSRWPDTAVVMITAVADVEVAVSCLSMGAMDYLTKPFHLEEVRARVRQALDRRRLILENREYQVLLEQRVEAQAHRIEEMFLDGIQALADALEVKDSYTRGHSVRVSQYSATIARMMSLDANLVRQIELGGHLHDIGKIGVRESVLNKPGPLTDDEYRHIMTHPVVGWRLLSQMMKYEPAALHIVRSHHERVDGSGVPDGLRGDDIPLEARIVSVADALDAMMSGRPYRLSEMTFEYALRELRDGSGRQFDKRVVESTIAAFENEQLQLIPRTVQMPLAVSH